MNTNFQLIHDFIKASNSSNSNTEKLEVLKTYTQHDVVRDALLYTYDPYKQYYVTSKNCKKKSDLLGRPNTYGSLFTLLDDLNNRVTTGHNSIANVNRFVLENKQFEDVIFNILDRNLKTRSTASTINKVFAGLIPTFDVALAKAYDEKIASKIDWNDGYYMSRKLDGVRCIILIDSIGDIKFLSRAGKEFLTLNNIKPSIQKLNLKNTVLDGEICVVDENGDEDFQGIIKEIKRKDHNINNPHYFVFDMLTLNEFTDKTSDTLFIERLEKCNNLIVEDDFISVLPQYLADDVVFANMMSESKSSGWEGLMIRKNTTYKGKRSNDILKVKEMHDAEYTVKGVEYSINRVIVSGVEIEEEMLKNIIIEHRGNSVQVGSGFSIDQRRKYFKNPESIIGKQVTVQYFEETTNISGTHSLRFPVIKAIYENNRNF